MGVTTTLLTVEQFAELPQQETERSELVQGEIVRMGNAADVHEIVKANCAEILTVYNRDSRIGKVFSETMYKLGPGDACQPDVSLQLKHRLPPKALNRTFEGAPELAFEVVRQRPPRSWNGRSTCICPEARVVWVNYPLERTLWIHRASGEHLQLREGQYVEEPNLLPGFRALVHDFFDGI